MKKVKLFSFLTLLVFSFIFSCSKSDDSLSTEEPETETEEPVVLDDEVNDFIWSSLNEVYLWQGEVPNLADDKFASTDDYYEFLNSYDSPESIFEDLLYRRGDVDKYSAIINDSEPTSKSYLGTTKSNGLEIGLGRITNTNDVFGFVYYVANNSDAASKDIKRGDFFLSVDDQQLTVYNYEDLLFGDSDTYTLGMATINNNTIQPSDKNVTLTKTKITDNPIHISKVIETQGIKAGYFMFHSFNSDFDNELNATIADLKAQGITELVLDLRYNSGGDVNSALALCSMITGQFYGDVLMKEQWNDKYQSYYEEENPERLINRFPNQLPDGTPIASLNLNKVYILTTQSTASASELIINGLNPYIDVVQIGTNTTGKYTASIKLYDADDYSEANANPNHSYYLQPLVYKALNANDVTEYADGLEPDFRMTYQTSSGSTAEGENIVNLGTLGDENEPFLEKALSLISGTTTKASLVNKTIIGLDVELIAVSNDFKPLKKAMFTSFKPKN
ncbi:peptidase S41 [Tamlana haliotis]|uniref:Peptidase S41 n=1 Tax=Pseudotamlana haliotis TaxID=2614804 RepID=A0A6N6MIN1_9FLAO|nr:S41 family peptidase [Tamlana haliotis]KAB1069374.1 peptidase S41 [Tamlana haliotis]